VVFITISANLVPTNVPSKRNITVKSDNWIADENDTIISNDGKEVVNNDDDCSNEEKTFYFKVNEYRARLKYSKKTMFLLEYYHRIILALKHTEGGKSSGIDAKFHGWCKHHFKIDNTFWCSVVVLNQGRSMNWFCAVILQNLEGCSWNTGHGSRNKMRYEVDQHYCLIRIKLSGIIFDIEYRVMHIHSDIGLGQSKIGRTNFSFTHSSSAI